MAFINYDKPHNDEEEVMFKEIEENKKRAILEEFLLTKFSYSNLFEPICFSNKQKII
jgi:hypothetical protein